MDDFRISDMFLDLEDSDFDAHVETLNETELVIPVHGFLLRRASNVFRTMLKENSFKEGATKILKIKILGYEDDAKAFFRYIHTGKLGRLDSHSYIALLQVAHLYEVKGLFELCEQRIMDALSPYSVCQVYKLLEKIGSETFLLYCKAVMLKFAFLIFAENLHTGLNEETLNFLLGSDQLNVQNEGQAVQALWVWAHTNCISVKNFPKNTLEDTLKRFLQFIRSPNLQYLPKDSPWIQFVEQNKDLLCKKYQRKSSDQISMKDFSYSLIFSQCAFSDQTSTADKDLRILDLGVSRDVYLIGMVLSVKYNHLDRSLSSLPLSFKINGSYISDLTCKGELINSESINDKRWHTIRFVLEFSKPMLLSRTLTNKITASLNTNSNYLFSTYDVKGDTQLKCFCSGEKVNFMVTGKVTGVHEIFYILK